LINLGPETATSILSRTSILSSFACWQRYLIKSKFYCTVIMNSFRPSNSPRKTLSKLWTWSRMTLTLLITVEPIWLPSNKWLLYWPFLPVAPSNMWHITWLGPPSSLFAPLSSVFAQHWWSSQANFWPCPLPLRWGD